jgi:hypothetical protein
MRGRDRKQNSRADRPKEVPRLPIPRCSHPSQSWAARDEAPSRAARFACESSNLDPARLIFRHVDGRDIEIYPKSGLSDVVAIVGHGRIVADTKVGTIGTTQPGPTSRIRRGLCEVVGLLVATPFMEGTRQVALVPNVDDPAGSVGGYSDSAPR